MSLTDLIPGVAAIKAIAILALVATIFGAGWTVRGWEADATISRMAEASAKAEAAAQKAAWAHQAELQAAEDRKQAAVAAAEARGLDQLRKATDETNKLRQSLAAGTLGLRIHANCPSGRSDMPAPSASPGVDPGTSAALAPDAEQAYLALREGIGVTESRLAACQDALRARSSP